MMTKNLSRQNPMMQQLQKSIGLALALLFIALPALAACKTVMGLTDVLKTEFVIIYHRYKTAGINYLGNTFENFSMGFPFVIMVLQSIMVSIVWFILVSICI